MARTDDDIKTEMENLEKQLSSGVASLNIDGTTTTFRTPGEINQRLAQLRQELQRRNGDTETGIYKNISFGSGGNL